MKRVFLVVGLAACGSVGEEKVVDAKLADAKDVDAPPDADTRRCDPTKPFGAPIPLEGANSASNDAWPTLTADELTVYFHSDRGGAGTLGSYDVFVATRPSLTAAFGMPGPLANVNTSGPDECPSLTADGRFLYVDRFASGTTGWDIWVAQRANTTVDFGGPTRVDSLNSAGNVREDNQFVLPDNSAMYFETNRTGNAEIFRAARNVGGTFETASSTLILAASDEISMAVTPDELTMYFASNATPTLGGYDIWMTKRSTTADGWGTPTHMTDLSTDTSDIVTWLSPDGCNIYLSRTVTGQADEIYWARKPL
jgi:Tol biopolymer transport system component